MLIIVPARKGSKGIPGKNTKPFRGFALIEWSFAAAQILARQLKATVVCTTDDPEIAALIDQHYKDSIHLHNRAADLAKDSSGMAAVVLDVCQAFDAKNYVLLQPTSPLRLQDDLQKLAEITLGKTTAVSCSTPCEHPEDIIILNENQAKPAIIADKTNRRQDRKTEYRFVDGSFYSGAVQTLRETNSFLPEDAYYHTLQTPIGADIDTPFDWAMAEAQHDWLIAEGYDFVRPAR
ncbi:MAG TPA: hypothetical protein DD729_04155 [Rhodobacteraceae bacterium]|jgi:CMP-N-acetylneuraminic acid synthetase|nr:hypothetical protein [Paracoccaceae bacterium]